MPSIILSPQHQVILAGVVLALALSVFLLSRGIARMRARQRERDNAMFSPDTDDPVLLREQIDRLQPVLLRIELDGVDELRPNLRESERAALRAGIEALLEEWAAKHEGLFSYLEDDHYQLLVQPPMLRRMIDARFDILDSVRAFQFRGRRVDVTISIGVGQGTSFAECGENSRQALDLALGRGGDQAAVKNPDFSYQFYGGVSKRVEKSEKVKVRIMATAFAELMRGCEQVYAIGHRRADFDCLGACAGICAMAKAQGKPAYIVTDCDDCMARPMLDSWQSLASKAGQDGAPGIITPKRALSDLSAKTLVVLADAHAAAQSESPRLIEQAKMLAVIDHHRQAVDHISNALVFYLDPGVSSASEMVTELLQYTVPAPKLTPPQADALLAGITLDTRNFVLATGASTFEAAAWLRGKGADPVRVKGLFAGAYADMKRKFDICSHARIVNRCAISIAVRTGNDDGQDLRLVCAQAADELLNLGDVDAAFVLFAQGGYIHISARSMGARNVQLAMEQLGGGGHQTMAAAQLSQQDFSMEDAVRMLMGALE